MYTICSFFFHKEDREASYVNYITFRSVILPIYVLLTRYNKSFPNFWAQNKLGLYTESNFVSEKIKVKSLTNRTIYMKDNYNKMKRTATSPTIPPKRSRLSGIFTNMLIICNINNITHIQQDSIFDGKTFTEQFDMPVFDKMVKCVQLRDKPNCFRDQVKYIRKEK